MESDCCNLQTGSDFPQLASTCSDCKIGGKSGQKSRSVFQALHADKESDAHSNMSLTTSCSVQFRSRWVEFLLMRTCIFRELMRLSNVVVNPVF